MGPAEPIEPMPAMPLNSILLYELSNIQAPKLHNALTGRQILSFGFPQSIDNAKIKQTATCIAHEVQVTRFCHLISSGIMQGKNKTKTNLLLPFRLMKFTL